MMQKVIIVAGSSGCGKSSLLKTIKEKRYKIVNIGTIMLEEAIKRGHKIDRDKIKYLPTKTTSEMKKKAFEDIEKEEGNIIVDTHAFIGGGGRFITGLPYQVLERIKNVVGLIYIDANTDEILKRRKADKSRRREIEDKRMLEDERSLNLALLSHYSSKFDRPLFIINNKEGDMEESVENFNAALKEFFGE